MRYIKGEWLHHLGIRLRQRSLYCIRSVTVLFSSTHFPGFCLGRVCHKRYKRVWTNMKSRCGCKQIGILYSWNFLGPVKYNTKVPEENNMWSQSEPKRGQDVQFRTLKTRLSRIYDMDLTFFFWIKRGKNGYPSYPGDKNIKSPSLTYLTIWFYLIHWKTGLILIIKPNQIRFHAECE